MLCAPQDFPLRVSLMCGNFLRVLAAQISPMCTRPVPKIPCGALFCCIIHCTPFWLRFVPQVIGGYYYYLTYEVHCLPPQRGVLPPHTHITIYLTLCSVHSWAQGTVYGEECQEDVFACYGNTLLSCNSVKRAAMTASIQSESIACAVPPNSSCYRRQPSARKDVLRGGTLLISRDMQIQWDNMLTRKQYPPLAWGGVIHCR